MYMIGETMTVCKAVEPAIVYNTTIFIITRPALINGLHFLGSQRYMGYEVTCLLVTVFG